MRSLLLDPFMLTYSSSVSWFIEVDGQHRHFKIECLMITKVSARREYPKRYKVDSAHPRMLPIGIPLAEIAYLNSAGAVFIQPCSGGCCALSGSRFCH